MQAIQTKYLPATNVRGARIKATCDRGSLTVSYPDHLSGEACHVFAADALVKRFVEEDEKRYGTHKNPWSKPRVCGGLKDGSYAHVFIDQTSGDLNHVAATATQKMRQALLQMAKCNLSSDNCASLEVASKRIRNLAQRALSND